MATEGKGIERRALGKGVGWVGDEESVEVGGRMGDEEEQGTQGPIKADYRFWW